jgi:hypothetical protein
LSIPFHTIWLGACPPLRVLLNLKHLLSLFEHELSVRQAQALDQQAAIPLLWLDASAWAALQLHAPLPLNSVSVEEVPPSWHLCAAELFDSHPVSPHWIHFHDGGPMAVCPVLVVEEVFPVLVGNWQSIPFSVQCLSGPAQDGWAHFLRVELGSAGPAMPAFADGLELLRYFQTLICHTQQHWAASGLLCLASDLLRLLVLSWLPGAYGDLGDVAGRLRVLPRAADGGPEGFCGHHTVAIENDLILCTRRPLLQAITLATGLWSWRRVRSIAQRHGLAWSGVPADQLLRSVLPLLDCHLPVPPSLEELLQPPWIRLADWISMAYGAAPLFLPASTFAAFTAGRQGKELLINEIGGFTGYQKAASWLAPSNAGTWSLCADRFGLADYAPQLGWRMAGFGLIDRLVDLGRRLEQDGEARLKGDELQAVRRDLGLLALRLPLTVQQLEQLSVFCYQLHSLLALAHLYPASRSPVLGKVERLCQAFDFSR